MSVSNGQLANQTTFNAAFISRTVDSSASGVLELLNADAASGDDVENIQREHNSIAAYAGKALNSAKDDLPDWENEDVGATSDNLTERADALTERFNESTGHTHSGAAGEGGAIEAASLTAVRLRGYVVRATNLTAVTGVSVVVTTEMTGKTASSGDTVKGVVVSVNNQVVLRDNTTATQGDQLRDDNGDLIFGRITEAAGVWTLSFYKNVAGVQTAHSFTAQDIGWYYQELFNPITDAPIYSEFAVIPSDNATQDVIDATSSLRGLMSAAVQTLGGVKTWVAGQIMQAYLALQRSDVASTASIASLTSAKSFIKLTGSTATTIHGITAGGDGQIITIHNGSSATATVKHQSGSAGAAGERLKLPASTDITIDADSSAAFIYDTGQSRWVVYSGSGSGSGGGGGSAIKWVESLDAPVAAVDLNCEVYQFSDAITQKLYALVNVPASYSAGKQIKLRMAPYSKDATTKTMLMIAVASLVRVGTDAIDSTTNQRTTTNTAVSIGAATVKIPQEVVLDLTDTTGNINGVAVAAGNKIQVELQRDFANDTSAEDVYVPVYGCEVTFNG
jgi:hypothetical protein